MVIPEDLQDFPGGPFKITAVMAAVESVRAEAGWHISPVQQDTVVLESSGGVDLLLPSRHVVSVDSVSAVGVTTWQLMSGSVLRCVGGCWPWGLVTVTMTHGWENVPADLLPVIASRARSDRDPAVSTQTVGPFSTSFSRVTASVPSRHVARLGIA